MKSSKIFESAIIGLFIGVIISTYLVFLNSTGGFVGQILNWVSLGPIINAVHLPDDNSLIYSFIFFLVVYTIYGIVVGMLIKDNKKSAIAVAVIILGLFSASFVEQKNGKAPVAILPEDQIYSQVASVIKSIPKVDKVPEQYFGNEVIGDLNGDGKPDVVFVISRNDNDSHKGILYYLSAAISTDIGHQGTNLIYLGEKMNPQKIFINNGTIGFDYTDNSKKTKDNSSVENASSTKTIYAQVKGGVLEQIDAVKLEAVK